MTNFINDRLFLIDPRGENTELKNPEFKYGLVFYNRNCKPNALFNGAEETNFLTQ